MILFDILCSEQTFLSPEISVCCMFVTFNQQECWGGDAFVVDVSSGRCDRFVFAAFNTILRHLLKNPSTLLPPSAFPLTSSRQPDYLLVVCTSCNGCYKSRVYHILFNFKIQSPPKLALHKAETLCLSKILRIY